MKPIYQLIVFFSFSIGNSAFSQTGDKLSLKACIEYTLKNNLSVSIYNNTIEIAAKQKLEALSGYLPQVNATGTLDDNLKRQVTVIPAGAFSPTDVKVQFGNQYNTSVMMQADQVIYDQSLLAGIKANKPNIELAELKKLQNDDNLIYNTAAAYYQLLIYREQVKLLLQNEKKLGDLLNVQKLQLEKGVTTRVAYNRVQVNYNNTISQRKVAETNYDMAMARLKNAMGIPVENELSIIDTVNYQQDVQVPVINDFNIKNKPDYLILEKNILFQEIDLKRKHASMLPTLSAYARYGANAFGNNFTASYDHWYDFSVVGLKLNVPIFSGLRRYSQLSQTELNLYNARQNLLIGTENIKLALQSSNTLLLSSYTNLQSNKSNIELAKTVFDDTSLQYEKGAVALTDFLNAEYAYKEAQTNYINSLLNYLVARIDLERSKGTIKQFVNQL
jgi:outer membrane protein TolC